MKKVIALALVALLLLSLTACGSKANKKETYIGTWKSAGNDILDDMMPDLDMSYEIEGLPVLTDFGEIHPFEVTYVLEFREDGTGSLKCDYDAYMASFAQLIEDFKPAYRGQIEAYLTSDAFLEGDTLESWYSYLNIDNMDDFLLALELDVDTMVESVFDEEAAKETAAAEIIAFTWKIENGALKVVSTDGETEDTIQYDEEKDTLTVEDFNTFKRG